MHARGAVGTGIESQWWLEAAEVVFGQWTEATDGGRRNRVLESSLLLLTFG